MGVVNIGVFGRRNVGKSSILNAIAGQNIAIVSDTPGTTTDPVKKRIEIAGLGACQLIDTAGIDDLGELGKMRVEKSRDIVAQIDIALLVINDNFFGVQEDSLMKEFSRLSVPVIVIHNKSDKVRLDSETAEEIVNKYNADILEFSTVNDVDDSKESLISLMIKAMSASKFHERPMFDGVVTEGETVLLVCPIDSEAPTGRLILPQVMAIRNLLDLNAVVNVIQPVSLSEYFPDKERGKMVDLVVVDSQIFGKVSPIIPENVQLTSFSMLLARSKGCFDYYIKGTPHIDSLEDGDRVLILESCSHSASCEDIGRVKIPALFKKYTGKKIEFDIVPGLERIARPVEEYSLVVQCGGCVITGRQLYSRLYPALEKNIPVTNYGMAISYMNGIYERAIKPLVK